MDVIPDEKKLGELILYVAKRLMADPKGGAVKINKILFASEFAHVRTYGVPITGVPYQKGAALLEGLRGGGNSPCGVA